jgi:hypothetical protein
MTPKEKAKELFEKMYFETTTKYDAKQCALIAVNEIIDSLTIKNYAQADKYEFWNEVKQDIENL